MSLSIQRTSITLLAGALLLTVSACASRPIADPDSRTGQAGGKLSQAGHKISEVSSDLWAKTKHVFRLDGTDAYHGPQAVAQKNPVEMPGKFKDEVDLVLVQDEFGAGPGNKDGVTLSSANADNAEMMSLEPLPVIEVVSIERSSEPLEGSIEEPLLAAATTLDLGTELEVGTELELATESVTEELIIEELAVLPNNGTEAIPQSEATIQDNTLFGAVRADLIYDVQADENLWNISKRLTGDATNWQQLAALNILDNNGTVYGGQKLQIPGDMLKPDFVDIAAPVLAEATPAGSSSSRLEVPTAKAIETVSEIVVADTANAPALPTGPLTSFKVQAGESMWEMARRTTGDATNWKNIAAANNMTPEEAALIKYGQSLEIPNDLLKTPTEGAATPAIAVAPVEEVIESVEVASAPVAVEPAVVEDSAVTAIEDVDSLKIVPANFQAEPTVIKSAGEEIPAVATDDADWVMVSGTYYPKAVYNDANFSATLLTRVSPGTKLQVSRAIGPWFEVKTPHGLGYVHSRDIK